MIQVEMTIMTIKVVMVVAFVGRGAWGKGAGGAHIQRAHTYVHTQTYTHLGKLALHDFFVFVSTNV